VGTSRRPCHRWCRGRAFAPRIWRTAPTVTHDPAPAKLLLQLFAEDRTLYADLVAGFEDCWKDNVRVVLATVADRTERKALWAAFSSTREAWRDAFEARGSARLTVLADLGT
jgi:hypothetical protein